MLSASNSITTLHLPELLRNAAVIQVAQIVLASYQIAVVDPSPLEMLFYIQRQHTPFRGFWATEKRLCHVKGSTTSNIR